LAHTTTGCGKQGFPSAQPYLSHTPGANPFCCMFLLLITSPVEYPFSGQFVLPLSISLRSFPPWTLLRLKRYLSPIGGIRKPRASFGVAELPLSSETWIKTILRRVSSMISFPG
ncbi:hypothetical protein BP00DRAFT_333044, partial [Aspergillus indologenus CBS 114.80]